MIHDGVYVRKNADTEEILLSVYGGILNASILYGFSVNPFHGIATAEPLCAYKWRESPASAYQRDGEANRASQAGPRARCQD